MTKALNDLLSYDYNGVSFGSRRRTAHDDDGTRSKVSFDTRGADHSEGSRDVGQLCNAGWASAAPGGRAFQQVSNSRYHRAASGRLPGTGKLGQAAPK